MGVEHPDITNSSRRIKSSEVDLCASNGVTDIVEVKIGYDGIVMASDKSAEDFDLTTVEQPMEAIGRRAVEVLLDEIEGRSDGPAHVVVSPRLIARGSAARIEERPE